MIRIIFALALVEVAFAFGSAIKSARITTRLNENFNPDDMTIISDPRIFTEKQLREYTATYSEDVRTNPLEAITDFFGGLFSGGSDEVPSNPLERMISNKISIALLEERTEMYVQGKLNPKQFATTLKAAFGPKLPKALPAIQAGLPQNKADALNKAI